MDDQTILDAVKSGDQSAFKYLVKQHHGALYNLVQGIVGSANAEDVVQEAWLAIYQGIPGFAQRSTLKTWMYRIASNKAITRWRKEKGFQAVSESSWDNVNDNSIYDRLNQNDDWHKPIGEWEESNPELILASEELQQCIERILESLPENQRAVFVLSQIHGQSTNNICNLLEITTSNVKVLLHRARLKLFAHIVNFQEKGEC